MIDSIIVLDAGAIGLATSSRTFRTVLNGFWGRGWTTLIPTPVLAEAITGGATDAAANQTIRRIGTVTTNESVARLAGRLRASATRRSGHRPPSAIDAIVAAHAVDHGRAVIFTTDPRDLVRLLADHPRIVVERP